MSWIKPLCIGPSDLVGARIQLVNHLGHLSEVISEAWFGSLVCESLARLLPFRHPFFGFPAPMPKRNTVRFLGRYFQVWYASICVFPQCKILNYSKNFLVVNSMNFRCMCFIFFKQFQLHLRKLLKVVLFVGVVFIFLRKERGLLWQNQHQLQKKNFLF